MNLHEIIEMNDMLGHIDMDEFRQGKMEHDENEKTKL